MEWKNLLKQVFEPKGRYVLIGTILGTGLILYVFLAENVPRIIEYICYLVSAYCLTILCVWSARNCKNIKKKIMIRISKNKYASRYFSDTAFKTVVSIYFSLAANLFYVVMNLINGIFNQSLWSVTLAVYYLFLGIMRFMLMNHTKIDQLGKNLHDEYQKYRLCAYILLLINFTLTGIVILSIHNNAGFSYAGYMIYVMAIYAFTNIIVAVVNLVKYRKFGSPIMSAAKVISFSSALISMLALEMAMLTSFDTSGDIMFRNRLIGVTGIVICGIFIAISAYMLIKARKAEKF